MFCNKNSVLTKGHGNGLVLLFPFDDLMLVAKGCLLLRRLSTNNMFDHC